MAVGSGFWLNAPPYDWSIQGNVGTPATVFSDVNGGDYGFGLAGGGGSTLAWAGVGSWFFAQSDDQQRAAALVQWSDQWYDISVNGYTAHNDMDTSLGVWGNTEQDLVGLAGGFSPHWSDGTGWFQQDGSAGGSGDWEGGFSETAQTIFSAKANQWYLVLVWSRGSVDDESGIFGFSAAQANISITVPFMVFG